MPPARPPAGAPDGAVAAAGAASRPKDSRHRRSRGMAGSRSGLWLGTLVAAMFLASTAHGQGLTDMKKGEGGSQIQGSAGPSGSQGANDLEHCDKPYGAMAVVEPQDHVLRGLARYQLGSPVGLIRLMIQQSRSEEHTSELQSLRH